MYTLLIEPDDFLLSGPTHSSAASSIGLEYATSSRVEADLVTQIRSILSRQLGQSSRTPHSSEDSTAISSQSIKLERFDFKSAKSVAKLARVQFTGQSSSSVSLAKAHHSVPETRRDSIIPMTVQHLPPSPAPAVRKSSSANDLRNASKLIVPPKSQATKIAIQNAPDTLLTCCSPYDPREDRIVIPTPSRDDRARRDQATSQAEFRISSSNKSYFDLQIRDTSSQPSHAFIRDHAETDELRKETYLRPSYQHVPGSYKTEISDSAMTPSARQKDGLHNLASDNMPADSREDENPLDFQAASFPRYLTISEHVAHGYDHPWDPIHPESMTPSITSGTSKGSARRHALLKPSVTPARPVDTGLPVQPVLTNVSTAEVLDVSGNSPKGDMLHAHEVTHGHSDSSRTPASILANLLNKQIPRDIEKRNNPPAGEDLHTQILAEDQDHESMHSEPRVFMESRSRKSIQNDDATPYAYWGFEQDERQRVGIALQEAIQKALRETVIPLGRKFKPDTDPYRQLVNESLAEAVRSADEILRRPSAWSTISDPNGQSVKIGLPSRDESLKSPIPEIIPPRDRVASLEAALRSRGTLTLPENRSSPSKDSSSIRRSSNNSHPDTTQPVPNPSHKIKKERARDLSRAGSDIVKSRSKSTFPAEGNGTALREYPSVMEDVPLDSPRELVETKHNHHRRYTHWDPPSSWNAFHFHRSGHKEGRPLSHASSLERIKNIARRSKSSSPSQLRNSEVNDHASNLSASESKDIGTVDRSPSTVEHVINTDRTSTGNLNAFAKAREVLHHRKSRKLSRVEEADSILPDGFDRHRTTHWLRQVLSNDDIDARRLKDTKALDQQKSGSEKRLLRSRTLPNKSAPSDSQVGSFPSDLQVSKNFAGAISNLEHLLAEALDIARQAASHDEVTPLPNAVQKASRKLDSIGEEAAGSQKDKRLSSPEVNNAENNHRFDSLHESRSSISSGILSPDMIMFVEEGPLIFGSPERHRSSATKGLIRTKSSAAHIEDVTIQGKENHHSASITRNPSQQLRGRRRSEVPRDVEPSSTQPRETDTRLLGNVMLPRCHDPDGKRLYEEDDPKVIRTTPNPLPNRREVREYIRIFREPPIQPRVSSLTLRKTANQQEAASKASAVDYAGMKPFDPLPRNSQMSLTSLDGTPENQSAEEGEVIHSHTNAGGEPGTGESKSYELKDLTSTIEPRRHISGRRLRDTAPQFLRLKRDKSHISIEGNQGFSLSRSHRRQPIARDWSPFRKRFVASVACINTALVGILVGIYAGEVPSIQYYIADLGHVAILGNVFFYIALAIPTLLLWPLPLLHGRKPYILGAMTIAMPLLVPQANCVATQRSPYTSTYRVGLILPRAFMGLALGFAYMNFLATLTDLFGASLMSGNPHQEVVDEFDVRRHGGGLGVWLGIWTWCSIGSLGIGFVIGAAVINTQSPDWGLYISIIIIATVLLLNVITPEVRRSAYRRSVAEVRTQTNVSRRVAKGEVKMHRVQTGPTWWGEELYHGFMLTLGMLRQPGFLVMTFYMAWIYGQIVLVIVLLGALMSRSYRFQSPYVGATTCAIPIGALLAVPFQKASIFSRARHHPQRTDSMTFQKRVTWSSHLVRRSIFTLVLPFADLAYTLCSTGPDSVPWILPVLFAGLIAFLSNLAIAECNGIIMEAFDTSDLQPGMTGRPRGASGERTRHKRTNYSSFPRVSAAFAITQSLGFVFAAGATGIGGVAQRRLGQQAATGVMAAILLLLTLLLLAVLFRWKEVQIIPTTRTGDMERWERARKKSVERQRRKEQLAASSTPGAFTAAEDTTEIEEVEAWRPVIIGNPSGKFRRVSILELGSLTRWSEIRRKNQLIDRVGLESRHPNLAALGSVRGAIREGFSLGGSESRDDDVQRIGGSERKDEDVRRVVGGSGEIEGREGERRGDDEVLTRDRYVNGNGRDGGSGVQAVDVSEKSEETRAQEKGKGIAKGKEAEWKAD